LRFRVLTLAVTAFSLAACSQDSSQTTTAGAVTMQGSSLPTKPEPAYTTPEWLASTSLWNMPVAADAPLDPSSRRLVSRIAAQAAAGATIASSQYGVPIYRVPADQPVRRVTLTRPGAALLQDVFEQVPIPADAKPAKGTDGAAVVVQRSTGMAWEFFRLKNNGGVFTAVWGGRLRNVRSHRGYYRDTVVGGEPVERWFWGAPATKFAKLGGVVTAAEIQRGRIDHAVAIAIPNARAGAFAFPAQASDGSSNDSDAVPEGAHFRLDPSLDVEALDVPPVTRMLARAAQRYGVIVDNQSGAGVSFVAEDPAALDKDPYPAAYEGVLPYQIAQAFPWSRLQLLKMDLRTVPHPDE
jgi:hypothetical protein